MRPRTRRLVVALVAVALASPSAFPPGAASAQTLRCPGAGGKTVARTAQARIFTRTNPRVPTNPNYFGCLSGRRAFRLNVPDVYGVLIDRRQLLVRGRYVALVQGLGDPNASDAEIVIVRDLATGQARYIGPRGAMQGNAVRSLVLKPNGSVAFVYRPPANEVHVVTTAGDRIVDQGPDIDPASLELSPDGTTITYVKAGEPRSTRFE